MPFRPPFVGLRLYNTPSSSSTSLVFIFFKDMPIFVYCPRSWCWKSSIDWKFRGRLRCSSQIGPKARNLRVESMQHSLHHHYHHKIVIPRYRHAEVKDNVLDVGNSVQQQQPYKSILKSHTAWPKYKFESQSDNILFSTLLGKPSTKAFFCARPSVRPHPSTFHQVV